MEDRNQNRGNETGEQTIKRCKVQDSTKTNNKSNNKHPFLSSFEESQDKQKQKYYESNFYPENDPQTCEINESILTRYSLPLNISQQYRFYLFTDVVFDTKFLRKVAKNSHIEYLQQNAAKSIYRHMKFINHSERKHDYPCTEMSVELIVKPWNIEGIQKIMDSMQNQQVHDIGQQYQNLWDLRNQYKQLIRNDNDLYYQYENGKEHKQQLSNSEEKAKSVREQRELSSQEFLKEYLKKLDGNKYIMYYYHKVDYHNETLENDRVGYTLALCELLGGDQILFQQRLLQRDFYEPLTRQFRLMTNVDIMENFFQHICNQQNEAHTPPDIPNQEIYISTVRGTILKARAKITRKNIHSFYDTFYPNTFKTYDVLTVFELDFVDPNLMELLAQDREKPTSFLSVLKTEEEKLEYKKEQESEKDSDNEYFIKLDNPQRVGLEMQYFKKEENESSEDVRNHLISESAIDDQGYANSENQRQEKINNEADSFLDESSEKPGKTIKEEQ